MSKKDKKIKKFKKQIEELTSRIDALEEILTNLVSQGIASIFEDNSFETCEDYQEEENDNLQEEDYSLFAADSDSDENLENTEDTKSKKKKEKKEKKKSKKKHHSHHKEKINDEEENFEIENDEDEEEDFLHNISDSKGLDSNEDFPIKNGTKHEKIANINTNFNSKDLQQLSGIGPSLADKLQQLGILSIQDLINISKEDEIRINEQIRGFSKKMNTYQWKEQSKKILDLQNDDIQ